MKLRYQMRGLGIGIIVTALLMGVIKGEKVPLSDAEIMAKAAELGMVESDSRRLSDINNGAAPSGGAASGADGMSSYGIDAVPIDNTASAPEEDGEEDGNLPSGESGESGSDLPNGEEDGDSGDTSPVAPSDAGEAAEDGQPQDGSPEESGESVTVVIESGATSYSVCQKLAQLGLVADASKFDDYLCDMGYSRSVREGTFEIPQGTSEERIAEIITGKR